MCEAIALHWFLNVQIPVLLAAVAKVVATAQPPVQYTCGKYREAHDAIVSSAAYNRALDIAEGVVKRVQVSTPCPSKPMFVPHM